MLKPAIPAISAIHFIDAQKALESAKRIKEFVLEKINMNK